MMVFKLSFGLFVRRPGEPLYVYIQKQVWGNVEGFQMLVYLF